MPGHKGIDICNIKNIFKYDITEISGMDNLLDSNGIIKETEDIYSNIYGSKKTIISTQGSTLGVQMMLTLAFIASKQNKQIIISRNIHVSAINTMALLDMDPIWVYPDITVNQFMPGLISAENLEKVILQNSKADVVYITSPNYFGLSHNIKDIAKICKKHNKILLIDNAHGAHFKFIKNQLHPMECDGVSACCDSLHKTLPVLTGGALLHLADERLAELNVKKIQKIYSSTSPSYLTLLSIDTLLNYIYKKLIDDLENTSQKIKKLNDVAKNIGLDLPKGKIDPLKYVIGLGSFNCTTYELKNVFNKFFIEPEYVNDYWLLFMFSPLNSNKDFKRVKSALKYIQAHIKKGSRVIKQGVYKTQMVQKGLPIKEAMFGQHKKVRVEDSLGEISVLPVTTSPPEVPILIPGEIVSRETIELLLQNGIKFLDILDTRY